jgi:hypothetical protein
MTESFTIEVELPVSGSEDEVRYVEIDVDCDYSVENDGIGPYEYWGSKEVDRGTDYAVIDNTDWDSTGFTKEEIELINSEIDKKLNDWSVAIMERVADRRSDYSFYSDGD